MLRIDWVRPSSGSHCCAPQGHRHVIGLVALVVFTVLLNAMLLGCENPSIQEPEYSGFSPVEVLAPTQAGAPEAADPFPDAKTVLWKIEKKGVKPSYLLGTIHIGDPRVTTYSKPLEAIIDEASGVVLEVVLDDQALIYSMQALMLTNGKTLADYVTPQELDEIMVLLTGQSTVNPGILMLKPWAVMVTLSQPPSSGLPMDMQIQERFKAANKTVNQLETIQEQLGIFDTLELPTQVALLRQAMDFHPQFNAMFNKMVDLYIAGDLPGLQRMSVEYLEQTESQELDELMLALVDVRNARMVERMQPFLATGNQLIAVGALHLPGEKGLLALLHQRGYQLSPILQ